MTSFRTSPDALRLSTIWTYWAGTAGFAVSAVWAGMGLQFAIRDTVNCGGKYADCTTAQGTQVAGGIASVFLFLAALGLSAYLRSFCEYPRHELFEGHQMHRLIPLGAWAIAFVDTVLDIGTPGTSGTRTALALAAFTIVFVVLSADLFWGATRTLLEPLDIIRGRVSVSALINAETSPKPSGEAPVELEVRIARWDRAMITSNVIYVLGGLLLGYSAYVALMPG
ncbi:hypothetical protein [Actinomadura chokoriensis]|uniref:hypothetical protein n=1 Tax=Actinomadura chokoriensis TaxID=454156 RepID=UPI0031F74A45